MISRETYRFLKSSSREKLNTWLTNFGFVNYVDGKKDVQSAIYRRLIDDFGWTDEQIQQLKAGVKKDVEAINERYITADEILDGLTGEGFNVR